MVLHPESGMRVLMTTDAVGGVWSHCLSLAGALQEHDVQMGELARQRILAEHTYAQRVEQVERCLVENPGG
jgi:hypothetical protein